MCEPKEPGFFAEELTWSKGHDWYMGLFDAVGNETIIGESSTHYTKLPVYRGVPQRIAEFNPHARFIYVMRDPIERLLSHYWHNVRDLQWAAERRPMLAAVREDPQYISFSDYAMQLRPYIELFGHERIHTLTFESMVAEPHIEVEKIFRWLGVDSAFSPRGLDKRWNELPENAGRVRGLGLLNRLRYSAVWEKLAPWVPTRLRHMASGMAEQPLSKKTERTDEVVEYVRPILLERVNELRELLGRDFPEWRTLHVARK